MLYLSEQKAFISYDAMLSIMPIMFLLAFIFQIISFIHGDAVSTMRQKELFNFVVVVADYTVKKGAAVEDSQGNLQPNLIDPSRIPGIEDTINQRSRHKITIMLGDDAPPQMGLCIYRLVVEKNSQDIKKLYVCGNYADS